MCNYTVPIVDLKKKVIENGKEKYLGGYSGHNTRNYINSRPGGGSCGNRPHIRNSIIGNWCVASNYGDK